MGPFCGEKFGGFEARSAGAAFVGRFTAAAADLEESGTAWGGCEFGSGCVALLDGLFAPEVEEGSGSLGGCGFGGGIACRLRG